MTKKRPGVGRYTLLATVKNEAPFLLEWLAYHKAIGFERFIIFSNDSCDGTTELLSALHDLGEVFHIPHDPPTDTPIVKTIARTVAASGLLDFGEWVIWLDADEFLNIHVGARTVSDLADVVRATPNAQGICISWRVFGASGNRIFHGRFVSNDFLKCDIIGGTRSNNKTLFRYDGFVRELSNHKPVMHDEFWCCERGFLGSKGFMMSKTDRYVRRWVRGEAPGRISKEYSGWNVAQINHYAVRTPELMRLKRKRGRIGSAQENKKMRYGQGYFKKYNRNEGVDRSILFWEDKTATNHADLISKISKKTDYFELIANSYPQDIVNLHPVARKYL